MTAQQAPLGEKTMAVLMAMLVALMPFSVDAYLPAIPEMAKSLGSDIHRIEQSLSFFMFGVAFGQVVGGSISDIKGRKPVALVGLSIYFAAVVGLTMVNNVEQLLNLRAVQAFGAGMTVVISGAMVRDYYSGRKAAQMFALIGIILMIVPLMAPMIGAGLQNLGGWRMIFGFLACYSLLLWGLMWYFLPKPHQKGKISMDVFGVVAGRFKRVLRTRAAMGYLFFQAFSFGSMFAFLTESSFVYQQLYHVSPNQYAWIFALNIITMMSFNRVTAWRLKTGTHPQNILKWGIIVQFVANLLMAVLVLLLSLPPLWALVLCVMFSVGTQGLVGANTQACFMSYFSAEGGSANAVLGVFQSLVGASVGMATTWLHNGSALVMAGMMLSSTVCGIVLLWICSHQAWMENDKKEYVYPAGCQKRFYRRPRLYIEEINHEYQQTTPHRRIRFRCRRLDQRPRPDGTPADGKHHLFRRYRTRSLWHQIPRHHRNLRHADCRFPAGKRCQSTRHRVQHHRCRCRTKNPPKSRQYARIGRHFRRCGSCFANH